MKIARVVPLFAATFALALSACTATPNETADAPTTKEPAVPSVPPAPVFDQALAPEAFTCFETNDVPPCEYPAYSLVTGLVYLDPVRVELYSLAVTIDEQPLYSGDNSTASVAAPPDLTWELDGFGGDVIETGTLDPQWTKPGQGLDEIGGYFDIVLPDVSGATKLTIFNGADVVAERSAGDLPPDCSHVVVAEHGRDTTVTWLGGDEDGDPLTYTVIVRKPGQPLQIAARRVKGEEYVLTDWIDEGDRDVVVQVVASDGLNASWARSAPFSATDDPPVLWFESGDEVMDLRDYYAIDVRIYGYDPEDGQDIVATTTWTSSIDGELFTGTEFYYFDGKFYRDEEEIKAPKLSSGEHIIAATLTDSAGQSTSLHFVLIVP